MKIAFTILCLICALLIGAVMYLLTDRINIVELCDEQPNSSNPKDYWLKLQNEGKKYIKVKNGKIYLKVVK